MHILYQSTESPVNTVVTKSQLTNDEYVTAITLIALQRPTITAYSNIQAPEPQPAVVAATTAPNIINISGSSVVINQ